MNLDLDRELNTGLFTGRRSVWYATLAAVLLFALNGMSGCALMGGLRPDFDDEHKFESEPTSGGRFSEVAMLDEGRFRGPDSENARPDTRDTSGRMGGQGTWLNDGESDPSMSRRPSGAVDSEEEGPKLANRPVMQKKFKSGGRATRADFIDDAKNDGSLWNSDGQTNYFLTKNNIHSDGDLVTVITDEEFLRDVAAELKRTLRPEERENEIELAQESMKRRTLGIPEETVSTDKVASAQAMAARTPASDDKKESDIEVPTATWADVDLRKAMEIKAGDPVMMEVLERYPNGNYKIRGVKKVRIRGQTKIVSVVAIAKHADIGPDESIPAGKLYEYRIESVR